MYKAAICVLLTFGAATGALYKKYPLIERQAVDRLFWPTGDTYQAFILFVLVKSRHIEVRKQPGCFNYVRSATIEIKTEKLNTGSKPVCVIGTVSDEQIRYPGFAVFFVLEEKLTSNTAVYA